MLIKVYSKDLGYGFSKLSYFSLLFVQFQGRLSNRASAPRSRAPCVGLTAIPTSTSVSRSAGNHVNSSNNSLSVTLILR